MIKSNPLRLTAIGVFALAGIAAACSSTKYIDVPNDEDGTAGKTSSHHAGSSGSEESSSAGVPGNEDMAGAGKIEPQAGGASEDAGSAGAAGSTESGGTAASSGSGGSAGSSGTAGTAGTSGQSGSGGSGGFGGMAGNSGSSGTGGSGGGAGKAGAGGGAGMGGTGGGAGTASGGTAGKAGAGGNSGNGGSAGAAPLLYVPASSTCSAGNVLAAFTVCRNCHVTGGAGPFPLVTLADIKPHAAQIVDAVTSGLMPKAGTLTSSNKSLILAWLPNAVGVPDAACP